SPPGVIELRRNRTRAGRAPTHALAVHLGIDARRVAAGRDCLRGSPDRPARPARSHCCMFLTRSLKQKIAATCGAVFGMVLFYEVTMLDSKTAVEQDEEIQQTTAKPAAGLKLRFAATAYCKGTTTSSGTTVQTGIAAADPDLLPVGSVIQV